MSPGQPVETHRPDVGAGLGVDQVRRDPHPRAVALDRAFEQEPGAQLPADLARVRRPAAERKRRGARDHVEVGEARKLVQDRFGDARREHVALARSQVRERQHGDRHALRSRRAKVRLPYQQHGDGGEKNADDRQVRVASNAVHDRPPHTFGRGVARDAAVTGLVEPGERDGHRKAEDGGHDQRHHHPARDTQRPEGDVGDLQQQPGDDGVTCRDADHAPLAQAMQPGCAGGLRHVCAAAYGLDVATA